MTYPESNRRNKFPQKQATKHIPKVTMATVRGKVSLFCLFSSSENPATKLSIETVIAVKNTKIKFISFSNRRCACVVLGMCRCDVRLSAVRCETCKAQHKPARLLYFMRFLQNWLLCKCRSSVSAGLCRNKNRPNFPKICLQNHLKSLFVKKMLGFVPFKKQYKIYPKTIKRNI